ncbi:hypothetical protein PT974_10508 [Cladobotryum mycophilum]|uniref:Uncharacterized protein n=1 Tax=Cladobotryum mycophilum TaxID=491253 RepID=A0ABR0SB20_9HYPO
MRFSSVVPVAFAALAAARERAYNGIVFAGLNYTGGNQVVYPPGNYCLDLGDDLKNNIHSVRINPESLCVLFARSKCQGSGTAYFEDTDEIDEHHIASVKCEDPEGPRS